MKTSSRVQCSDSPCLGRAHLRITTAVKCPKTGSSIPAATIEARSRLLEQEIALFPNAQVYQLMGDVAIRAINLIAGRNREPRVLPSYLQAGAALFVEKSKRQMIAEDIRQALWLAVGTKKDCW